MDTAGPVGDSLFLNWARPSPIGAAPGERVADLQPPAWNHRARVESIVGHHEPCRRVHSAEDSTLRVRSPRPRSPAGSTPRSQPWRRGLRRSSASARTRSYWSSTRTTSRSSSEGARSGPRRVLTAALATVLDPDSISIILAHGSIWRLLPLLRRAAGSKGSLAEYHTGTPSWAEK